MKNTILFFSFIILFNVNNLALAQSCQGLVYDFSMEEYLNEEQFNAILKPPQFQVEGDSDYKNSVEILNAGANGLVICSPSGAGIFSTEASSYSAYFSNKESSSNAAVQIAHGDDEKMDLQLEGVGRTAGQDGYIVNIDSDEDGDESFLVTDGGGTNLFRVRESDGTFTKNLTVQGYATFNNYLSINGPLDHNAKLTLNSPSTSPVNNPMMSYSGLWGDWTTFVGTEGNLYFRAVHTAKTSWLDANGSGLISVSDIRHKKNISILENVLPKIEKLVPSRYHYNNMNDTELPIIGLMAQDLEAYFPEVVEYSKDTDQYGVNYGQVSVIAIQAIKEQQILINQQKEMIDALESSLIENTKSIKVLLSKL